MTKRSDRPGEIKIIRPRKRKRPRKKKPITRDVEHDDVITVHGVKLRLRKRKGRVRITFFAPEDAELFHNNRRLTKTPDMVNN